MGTQKKLKLIGVWVNENWISDRPESNRTTFICFKERSITIKAPHFLGALWNSGCSTELGAWHRVLRNYTIFEKFCGFSPVSMHLAVSGLVWILRFPTIHLGNRESTAVFPKWVNFQTLSAIVVPVKRAPHCMCKHCGKMSLWTCLPLLVQNFACGF